jgi:hypothetical protein
MREVVIVVSVDLEILDCTDRVSEVTIFGNQILNTVADAT